MLNAEAAAAIVSAEFPSLAPIRTEHLGEGCDSVAFVVNSELVFRFPKRNDVAEQLLREFELLPQVARRVPVRIPIYTHVARPSERFPRPFGGYPLIPGTPAIQLEPDSLSLDVVAEALAAVFSGLRRWEHTEAARLGIPPLDVDDVIDEAMTDALDDFELLAQLAPDGPLERWHAFLTHAPPAPRTSRACCVVHADLAAEHVLFDSATSRVTGVIDWSEIAVGDPAIDFAGVFHWGGPRLMHEVLRRYEGPAPDANALVRARHLAACRGVMDVRFGRDFERTDYIRGGLRALELCVPA